MVGSVQAIEEYLALRNVDCPSSSEAIEELESNQLGQLVSVLTVQSDVLANMMAGQKALEQDRVYPTYGYQ